MWLILLSIIFLGYVCIKLLLNYTYWSRKGVIQFQPWPIFGNTGPVLLGKISFTEVVQNLYRTVPDKRYCGMYTFLKPAFVVRCPDLIKLLTVEEFDTFPEHRFLLPPEADPLYTDNVFTMRGGQKWRDRRSSLTPSLTSRKLKVMFESMLQCAGNCMAYLEKREGDPGVEMMNAFSRYNNDVMYRTTYGVVCDSFKNPENEFYLMGRDALSIMPWRTLKTFLNSISPILVKVFQPRIASGRVNRFYGKHLMDELTRSEIDYNNRFDVINFLLKSRKKFPDVLTDEEILNQAFVFYLGGLATSTAAMCYTMYELALNPDVQKKLQLEIDNTSELSYSSISEMKYLDMVVSETLRKWPPSTYIDRRSVKPFTIEAVLPNEKPVHLEAGTELWIPIYSLHRDPAYYPDPEKFDPERFSDKRKSNINQFAYLPFGAGPKKCIGSRFALLAIKLLVYLTLQRFDVVPNEKTPIPVTFDRYSLAAVPNRGFWIQLQFRKHRNN